MTAPDDDATDGTTASPDDDATDGTTASPDVDAAEDTHDDDATDHVVEAHDDEAADGGVEADAKRSLPYTFLAGAAVAVVVTLGALTACALMGWQLLAQHRIDAAGRAAQETATGYAETLTSIDANRVDENFADVLNGATGEFKDMYTQSSVQLRQLLIDNKATAHGTVVDSAIEHASEDSVTVLLMVDQTVSNTSQPDDRVDRSRMKITMQRVDDRWLANKVELP